MWQMINFQLLFWLFGISFYMSGIIKNFLDSNNTKK